MSTVRAPLLHPVTVVLVKQTGTDDNNSGNLLGALPASQERLSGELMSYSGKLS